MKNLILFLVMLITTNSSAAVSLEDFQDEYLAARQYIKNNGGAFGKETLQSIDILLNKGLLKFARKREGRATGGMKVDEENGYYVIALRPGLRTEYMAHNLIHEYRHIETHLQREKFFQQDEDLREIYQQGENLASQNRCNYSEQELKNMFFYILSDFYDEASAFEPESRLIKRGWPHQYGKIFGQRRIVGLHVNDAYLGSKLGVKLTERMSQELIEVVFKVDSYTEFVLKVMLDGDHLEQLADEFSSYNRRCRLK